jgi:hypothetical protein
MSETESLGRSLTRDVFPHRCQLGAIDFEITEYSLDGQPGVTPEQSGEVDLLEYQGWDEVELTVEVSISDDALEDVFPESSPYPGRLVIAGHCRATYLRDREVICEGNVEATEYTDEMSLRVQNVAGEVELRPLLVRDAPRVETEDYGVLRGTILADGPVWTVQITEDDPGGSESLEVDYTSFAAKHEENNHTRFPSEQSLYYLDLEKDPAQPVLWFNEDHDRVVTLLRTGESDLEITGQETIWTQAISETWSRMLTIAALEFEAEESEWEPEWHAGIFDRAASYLFPEEDVSARGAAKRLRGQLEEGGHVDATARIERAVQEMLDTADIYETLAQEVVDS